MSRSLFVAALLTAGISLSSHAQTNAPRSTDLPVVATLAPAALPVDPPRAATVLALATPASLPDLAAPLPAAATPLTASPTRPADSNTTIRWVLGIVSAAGLLLLAITAANK